MLYHEGKLSTSPNLGRPGSLYLLLAQSGRLSHAQEPAMSSAMSQGETATDCQSSAERSVTTSPDAFSVLSLGRHHIFGTARHSCQISRALTGARG
jgi:hypothetical protein